METLAYEKKDTRTIKEKIDSLKKLGVDISVMNEKQEPKDGYILGRMKDKYPALKIL